MFPDPTISWRPFPSIIDGLNAPFVLDRGLWRGVLHLMILERPPGGRAYGVEVACQAYFAVEEMIYSLADHGDRSSGYDGVTYIKEAKASRLLTAHAETDPAGQDMRQFLFVGTDFCYETLGPSEPVIRAFSSQDQAYEWAPGAAD